MNVIEKQMTVIRMPVVQMNEDHIHASVTMVILEMALYVMITLPVLRSEITSAG